MRTKVFYLPEEAGDKSKENGFSSFGAILPHLPSLFLRMGGTLLRFKRQAKKGAKTFHNELIDQGIDEETAGALTDLYLETSNIKNYMRLFRQD